jgi:hypothetical protein
MQASTQTHTSLKQNPHPITNARVISPPKVIVWLTGIPIAGPILVIADVGIVVHIHSVAAAGLCSVRRPTHGISP